MFDHLFGLFVLIMSQTFAFSAPLAVTIAPIVDVVICGGGLGGLALANGLLNMGLKVVCCEKNSEFRPTGANLGLAPNAFKALNLLKPGLDKMIFDNGVQGTGMFQGFSTYAWANVRNLLLPSNLDLRLSSEFLDLNDKDDAFIESHFRCEQNGNIGTQIIKSRVFIAADGIHSDVSKFLNGRQANPSGAFSWRCTVDSNPDAVEG